MGARFPVTTRPRDGKRNRHGGESWHEIPHGIILVQRAREGALLPPPFPSHAHRETGKA